MSSRTGRILIIISAIYLISITIRLVFPSVDKPHLNQKEDLVEWNGKEFSFTYLEFGSHSDKPPVIIFSDPFSNYSYLEPFALHLSNSRRVIIPTLSNTSTESRRAHHSAASGAEVAFAWLQHTGIKSFNLAGSGFGNAIALELMDTSMADYVESYALLSGIGVQEFHFLGYHVLNQPTYSMLYPIGFMVDYVLPIGGWNSHSFIDLERVRYINDLDQRPYRDILTSITSPVIILHGNDDRHVSKETAREHHRIIPQSEISIFEGDKHSIFEHYEDWADEYSSFLDAVDQNEAITKSDALTERLAYAERDFKFGDVPPVYGWGLVLILFLLSIVTLISEDLGCIGGGLLVAGGVIPLWIAFLVIYLGIVVVDVGIYWLGRKLGRTVIYKAPFRWFIKKRDVDWSAEMFHTNGFKIIFASRFLPGTRFPTYFTAGLLKTNFKLFLIYFLIAITIWTPLLLGISVIAGQQMLGYLQIYQDYALYIFISLALGLYILFKFIMPLATKKGRREFAVRVIRLRQRFTGQSAKS
ncbi:hypothetical protein BH23BAC3_BH23BAC3_11940 [soil metagenome]